MESGIATDKKRPDRRNSVVFSGICPTAVGQICCQFQCVLLIVTNLLILKNLIN